MSENLKFDRQFFKDFWRILKPYWTSEEKWSAYLLLATVIGCILVQVRISVIFNYFKKDFYNALQNFNKPLLMHLIGKYVLILIAAILVYGYNIYLSGLLTIRWRRWMTKNYLDSWLNQQTYYRMQNQHQAVDIDNPDQRISEDLDSFPSVTLGIFSNLLNSMLTLIAFGTILWGLSGDLQIPLGANHHLLIPGYLLWAALFYACFGTWLNAAIGRDLPGLNYLQQKYNANFRFSMARLREVSEQVAMHRGETVEHNKFMQHFKNVFDNFVQMLKVQKKLAFFQNGYNAASFVFGIMIAMPLFFAKKIQIGGVVQITSALDSVITAFSIFISLFVALAAWRSVIFRISEFSDVMAATRAHTETTQDKITITESPNNQLVIENVHLQLPDGSSLFEALNFTINPGETVLLTGASGIGKSTLLRALAGIWSHGSGKIQLPRDQKIMFMPQKPYLPLGSLRDALFYPYLDHSADDETLIQLLTLCGLEKLKSELDITRNWSQELSLGEQQMVGFIRIFLQKPDWIFLDEATSALDETTQEKMYQLLQQKLSNSTVISVGHRSSLVTYHSRKITLSRQENSGGYNELNFCPEV